MANPVRYPTHVAALAAIILACTSGRPFLEVCADDTTITGLSAAALIETNANVAGLPDGCVAARTTQTDANVALYLDAATASEAAKPLWATPVAPVAVVPESASEPVETVVPPTVVEPAVVGLETVEVDGVVYDILPLEAASTSKAVARRDKYNFDNIPVGASLHIKGETSSKISSAVRRANRRCEETKAEYHFVQRKAGKQDPRGDGIRVFKVEGAWTNTKATA